MTNMSLINEKPLPVNATLTTHRFMSPALYPGGSIFLLLRSYEEAKIAFMAILTVNLVVIILGIIVNVAICLVMLRKKRYQRNGSNFFILHLSVTELVYRLLVFPILIWLAVPSSAITTPLCNVLTIFSHIFGSVVFPSLVAIALDRYQNIAHPLKSLRLKRKPFRWVSLIWLYAAIASCPFSACIKSIPVSEIPEANGMNCQRDGDGCQDMKICDIEQSSLGQAATTLYFFIAFAVPVIVMVVLYTKIVTFLNKRSRNGMMHKLAARSKAKAVRMLIVALIGYVFSLGPAVVFSMVRSYGILDDNSFHVMLLVNWLFECASYTSSLGNPLIYAYYNGDFRREITQLCKRMNKTEGSSGVATVDLSQH
ncbi:neuropeptide FF receptor 1-like [Acropora palmata]|uniref:neuropeptide FF receptor 1-like n=1 Tax=Acropora palmata TaxID=6131 RepID=UPI003DA08D81